MKTLLRVVALLAVVTMGFAARPQTASAGSWADVCCGPRCLTEDYCLGDGNLTCCKPEEQ